MKLPTIAPSALSTPETFTRTRPPGSAVLAFIFLEPEHALGGLIVAHGKLGGGFPEGGVGGNRRVNRQERLGDRVERALEANLPAQHAARSSSNTDAAVTSNRLSRSWSIGGADR